MKTGFRPLTLPFLCLFRTTSPKSAGQGSKLKEAECHILGSKTMNKSAFRGLPGGSAVKNSPANAGETGSTSDPGRSHMPRSNSARARKHRARVRCGQQVLIPERLRLQENKRTKQNPRRKRQESPGNH